ncbi:MAG: SdrD B-like domain-containing protein, partial [Ignavibacteria bacterium]|nr:SdrD B-like domain-containing protein [Ignavibacteria bacterium]
LVNNASAVGHPVNGSANVTSNATFTVIISCKSSLGDKVWEDIDKDGIQDSGENGIPNVTVKLYTCADVLVATTTTNANGEYLFSNLTPGDYYVVFTAPAGYTITIKDAGSDNAKDSDADASTGKTICTTLTAGENDLTWDAGLFVTPPPTPASLGDKVWEDTNHNGIQDNGENGIANVTVKLYTCADVLVATTTSNPSGNYLFNNLTAGDYYVVFVKPNGMIFTFQNSGSDDAIDSDVDITNGKTICTTLIAGENDLTWDAGLYNVSSTCDLTKFTTYTQGGWGSPSNSGPGTIRDAYFSAVYPSGLTVGGTFTLKLTSAQAVEDYLPDGGTAAALTQNYVNPTTAINVLAGQVVAMQLNVDYSAAGYLGATSFNLGSLNILSGSFSGMTVSQFLAIANSALGGTNTGYSLSDINAAATAINENFDNGTVNNGYLGCDEPKASLGDKVWEDTNHNGIQDSGENGIANVTVKLYTCSDVLVATTTTNANGIYSFTNLNPGDYYVVFTTPSGMSASPKDQGSNDAADSDADVTTGKTICTTLTAGENDLTWDAGFYTPVVEEKADLKIEKTSNVTNANCGDNVTYTIKVTNQGPNTAANVSVNDILPASLLYQSATVSQGSFNSTSGLWTVGTLANGAIATLTLTVKIDCGTMNSTAFDLGAATGFNLFVIEDLNQPSSDTEGKVAVGHNATFGAYSIGDKLPANSGDVLIVGNNLQYTSGQIYNGNVVYGNTTNLPQYAVTISGGTLRQDNP